MTREEAIRLIKDHIDTYVVCHGEEDTVAVSIDNVDVEAFDMAIEALEQERSRSAEITQYRYDCEKLMEENERLKKALEQEPCDCISREEVCDYIAEFVNHEYATDREHEMVEHIIGGIQHLPSIQHFPSIQPKAKVAHWQNNACSNCGIYNASAYKNWCPNCGCQMTEETDTWEE